MKSEELVELRQIAKMMRAYIELAVQEYEQGNIRQANTLYRRAKKISNCTNLPKSIGVYYGIYQMIAT